MRLRLWYDVYTQLVELGCDVNVHVPDTVFVGGKGELMGWFRSAQRKLERVDTAPDENLGSVLNTFFKVGLSQLLSRCTPRMSTPGNEAR